MIRCKHCLKVYVTLMGCKRHMVAKHDYMWWDNNDVYLPSKDPACEHNYDMRGYCTKCSEDVLG